jgi:hypothetical protein
MKKLLLGMTALAALTVAGGAQAVLKLKVDDITNATNLLDVTDQNVPSGDGNSVADRITSTFVDANWDLEVRGRSDTAGASLLTFDSLNILSSGSGELKFQLSEVGYSGDTTLRLDFTNTATVGTLDLTLSAYASFDNAQFGTSVFLGSLSSTSTQAATEFHIIDGSSGFYSLTIVGNVIHSGTKSESDLDASIVNIPEPSVIALFGAGLLGLGFARRRMSK